jgi:aminomethyltransferase
MPIPTPFHSRTSKYCESHEWREWAGYQVASTYEPSHEREYFAIRNAVALIDVSPLYKYEIRGPDATRLVNRIITRDITRCAIGQIFYTPWCDDDGKVIDDGTVAHLDDNFYRITAAESNLAWFQDCGINMDVAVSDVSEDLAVLAVQGPFARHILRGVIQGIDLEELSYYRVRQGIFRDSSAWVSRTGYTGDLGYEIWISPDAAPHLWDMLMDTGEEFGVVPAGLVALDIARIEAGLLMLQVDYISSRKSLVRSQTSSPFELGLGWTVDLQKKHFIGREDLMSESLRGSSWSIVGLEIDWQSLEDEFNRVGLVPQVVGRASRAAVPVYLEKRYIGHATSQAFSPILKKYIAIASLEKRFASIGKKVNLEITVEHVRRIAQARVVKLPFFNPVRKKA